MNTMKYIRLALALLLTACVAGSCNSMLEETPWGTYSNKTYYNNEEDAESALMYAYLPLNYVEYGARFMFYLGDLPTDQFISYGKREESPLVSWGITPDCDEFTLFFKFAYLSINRANSVLENVAGMKNITQAARNQILSEAYFLRAFNHFMLVKNFGSIPLRDKASNATGDTHKAFATIEACYGLIISDLEKAIELGTVRKRQGRTDRVAAQALLSRVYLTLASSKSSGAPGYEWVDDADGMYAKCAEQADAVLNGQTTYALDPDLANVYDVQHQADGVEHIFISAMNREASGYEGTFSQLPQMFGIQTNSILYLSRSLRGDASEGVTRYLDDNTTFQAMRVNYAFRDTYDDRDLRKQLMVTTIYNADGSVRATFRPDNVNSSNSLLRTFFFPFCRKYTDPESKAKRCSANIYFIRFAEVALNYAEAVGPTEEGYRWINAVRERSGLDPLPEGLSVEAFRDAVLADRTFELAFEGHGIYDLRRMNRVNRKWIDPANKTIDEQYAYFYPVPQRELDLNQQ